MKLLRRCLYAICLLLLASPIYGQGTLWYSGDPSVFDAGIINGIGYGGDQRIYQDFFVAAPGWNVTAIFTAVSFPPGPLAQTAFWEIRSGLATGNSGALVSSGTSPVTLTATGVGSDYNLRIDGLSIALPPGHYWLAIVPINPGSPGQFQPATLATSTFNSFCVHCGVSSPIVFNTLNTNAYSQLSSPPSYVFGVFGTIPSGGVPPSVCMAQVFQAIVRAEGVAEKVADITLTCMGGTPTAAGQPIPLTTFQVNFNTTGTSRLLAGLGTVSEATLTIDEPHPATGAIPDQTVVLPVPGSPPQIFCAPTNAPCVENGTGGSSNPYQNQPNVFLGQQTAGNIVTWSIPFDPPGPVANRVVRITNLRVNASQLPVSQTLIPTSILASISINGQQGTVYNPDQTVAFMQPGLRVDATTASFAQCSSHNTALIGGSGTPTVDLFVNVAENFASVFQRRDIGLTADGSTAPPVYAQNVNGYPYNTESNFYSPGLFASTPEVGLADFGTRIRLTFNNVGPGVRIFVPTSVVATSSFGSPQQPPSPVPPGISEARLILVQADQYGNSNSPGYAAVPSTTVVAAIPMAEVSYHGSTASATYEVVNSDPNAPETAAIRVAVAISSAGNVPAPGQVTVNVSEAPSGGPLAGIPSADALAPIPRFADTSVAQPAFSINPCATAVTVTTNPVGLQVLVDSVTTTSPQTFNWTPGTSHTIAVASLQGDSGSRYLFSNWSDGGAQSHSVTAPALAATFTANSTHQYFLTMNAGVGGTVSPASNWFNAGQSVQIGATPGSSAFIGWSGTGAGSFTGATANASVAMNGPVTETASFGSGSNGSSASFVKSDATTQGNWRSVYGGDGYIVVGNQSSNPSYVAPLPAGQSQAVWAGSTGDVRALQKASNPSDRIAAAWYAGSTFSVDLNITDANTHQIAAYFLDWDTTARREKIEVLDAIGNVLNTQTLTGSFHGGVYLVWNVKGHVKLRVTLTGGANPVLSGLLFGGGSIAPTTATAAFVQLDGTTQGNWHGTYGAEGYIVVGDQTSNPPYVTPAPSGQSQAVWVSSSSDARALTKPSNLLDRVAGVWYAGNSFTVDLPITDSMTHRIALYCLDWDTTARRQTVDILDVNGNVLNTQTLSGSFHNGVYLVWNVSGHVKVRVTLTGGANPVISGLFFGGTGTSTSPLLTIGKTHSGSFVRGQQGATYAVTVSNTSGAVSTSGTVTVAETVPPGLTLVSMSGTGWSCGSSTCTRADALAGGASYPAITVSVNVGASASSPQVNQVSVSGGGSPPANTSDSTVVNNPPVSASVEFFSTDTLGQGSWRGHYGADGYILAGDQTSNPTFVTPVFSGQSQAIWTSSTNDLRGLQKGLDPSSRIAAAWYAANSFMVDLNITDGNFHEVSLYFLDWDTAARRETVDVLDANGTVLGTWNLTDSFHGGIYLTMNLSGHVKLRITRTAGANAVLSGLFFGAPGFGAAGLDKVDATTQGNWHGIYGVDGYIVVGDQTANPVYITPAPAGQSEAIWASSTTDARGLEKGSNPAARIAGVWYGANSFTIDLKITDGTFHHIALYCVDWDTTSRRQTVEVLDPGGAILDTQTLTSSFHDGVYLVWSVAGHVKLRVTRTAGANAVMSGLFFN